MIVKTHRLVLAALQRHLRTQNHPRRWTCHSRSKHRLPSWSVQWPCSCRSSRAWSFRLWLKRFVSFVKEKDNICLRFYNGCFYKWANPDLFLFIFGLFKHKFYRKTVGVSGIRTWIVRLQGDHADNLTTTTSQMFLGVGYSQSCPCRPIVRF